MYHEKLPETKLNSTFPTLKVLGWLAVILALITGAYLLGPQVEVDEAVKTPELPKNLNSYLWVTESQYALRPGTEKKIVWSNPRAPQITPYSVVYLHGFSASRQEIDPFCEQLVFELRANLFLTRLAGHGRDAEAMAEPEVKDWLQDALEAYAIGERLGRKVIVVGTSTGATLALWLALREEAKNLQALVLLSPNFSPRNKLAGLTAGPWGDQIMRLFVGTHREFMPESPEHARGWTTRYRSEAIPTLMGLVKLVERLKLEKLTTPTFMAYSPNDKVVDVSRIEQRFAELGTLLKVLVPYDEPGDPSYHVLAGRILSPRNTEALLADVTQFLRKLE